MKQVPSEAAFKNDLKRWGRSARETENNDYSKGSVTEITVRYSVLSEVVPWFRGGHFKMYVAAETRCSFQYKGKISEEAFLAWSMRWYLVLSVSCQFVVYPQF